MVAGKKIHASACEKVLIFTVDPPFKKGAPGYVSRETKTSGEVFFTSDIWEALVNDRNAMNNMLMGLRMRTKKALYTHVAVAMLYDPEAMR